MALSTGESEATAWFVQAHSHSGAGEATNCVLVLPLKILFQPPYAPKPQPNWKATAFRHTVSLKSLARDTTFPVVTEASGNTHCADESTAMEIMENPELPVNTRSPGAVTSALFCRTQLANTKRCAVPLSA
jgi:hypothetical protein